MTRKILALSTVMVLLLSIFVFTSGNAHAASLNRTTKPKAFPSNCLTILGGTSNTQRSLTDLSYNVTGRVRNGCTQVLKSGGGWIANFQVDCDGTLIDENPELSGGLLQVNVGATFTFLDGHYKSVCNEGGAIVAPDQVTIYVSVSGNLQNGTVATGSDYFIAA